MGVTLRSLCGFKGFFFSIDACSLLPQCVLVIICLIGVCRCGGWCLVLGFLSGVVAQVCPEHVMGVVWLGTTLESARKVGDGGLHPDLEPVQVVSCPL